MDNLKQYTQCSWFLDLVNILQLKELYKQLEMICGIIVLI